jgi:hypothetical protein
MSTLHQFGRRSQLLAVFAAVSAVLCGCQSPVGHRRTDRLERRALDNQDPEKWNLELFAQDKQWTKSSDGSPLNDLAFPVAKYEYYVFSKPFNFQIGEEHFSGVSFGENLGGKDDQFIFDHEVTVLFHTGRTDRQIDGDVSSRNFPHLTVQGQVELNDVYQFVGVRNPDGGGCLIVNLKAFDLRFGQTIIVIPGGDNSFLYLQSKEKPLGSDGFADNIERLKQDGRILDRVKMARR